MKFPAPNRESGVRRCAATARRTASSVAPVASGYERSLRPCATAVSRAAQAISAAGDRR